MRVNQPQWGNQNRNMQNQSMQRQPSMQQKMPRQSTNNMQKQNQGTVQHVCSDTVAMQLARKVKAEQGDKAAGYFLYAIRPFIAQHELMHIESVLQIRAERDPRDIERRGNQQFGGLNIMQLLMSLMRGEKTDPMSLMRMMTGQKMNRAVNK